MHIFREVAATFEKPALLFSGGKDSVVMLHLARKAFWPAPVPFPVMHVDTGQNFDEIREQFRRFAMKLEVSDLTFIPVSALDGDNVVGRSAAMPWYEGSSLLNHLEEVHVASDRDLINVRFPVQYVIRPHQSSDAALHDFRGYAGTLACGVMGVGDDVAVLPSGLTTRVSALWRPGGQEISEAFAGQAITVELADDIDIGRGDLICRPHNRPCVGQELDAMVCWLSAEGELAQGARYVLQHTTHSTRVEVSEVDYRLDVNTLHRDKEASGLSLNEIGRVRIRTQQSLYFDAYRRSRETGSFILVDEATNNTVAAGMITGPARREPREGHATSGATIWLTSLPGPVDAVAAELQRRLGAAGRPAYLLDGDNLRRGLNADLTFGAEDRAEHIRRAGEVAKLLADAGLVVIVALGDRDGLAEPERAAREKTRSSHAVARVPYLEFRLCPEDGDAAGQAALLMSMLDQLDGAT